MKSIGTKTVVVLTCVVVLAGSAMASMTAWTPSGSSTTFYSGSDGRSGTAWTPSGSSTTFYSGSLFRGGNGALFADKDFSSRLDEAAWLEAAELRDVQSMAQFAWAVKGVETALGKVDSKNPSTKLFKLAAETAVSQGNADAMKEIAALSPDCKGQMDALKTRTATRGSVGAGISSPQVVPIAFNMADELSKKLDGLKSYQRPLYTQDLIGMKFRGVSSAKAASVSTLVNLGRATMDPKTLALGAVELKSLLPKDAKVDRNFDAAQILDEAALLACDLNDSESLDFIVGLYKSSALKDESKVKFYQEQGKLIASTRGGEADGLNGIKTLIFAPTLPIPGDAK